MLAQFLAGPLGLLLAIGSGCSLTAESEPVTLAFGVRGEGEIEPCGCPENPRGGIARRVHAIEQLRRDGPLVVVDAGLSLTRMVPVSKVAGDMEQRQIKAELIAGAFAASQTDAISLGATDWALGVDYVRKLVTEHDLPVLAANLTCGGEAPYPGSKVVEAGGKRIGIVGVTDGEVEGCELGDTVEALQRAVSELGKVDIVVGLIPLQSPGEIAQITANQTLPIDIAIDGRSRTTVAGADLRGGVQFLSGGSEGKAVGVLSLRFVKPGSRWVPTDGVDMLEKELAMLREQREAVVERRNGAAPDEIERYDKQLEAYDTELERVSRELEESRAAVGTNWFAIEQIDLLPEVPDHEPTAALVKAAKRRIEMAGGEDPARFVPRRVDEGPYLGGEGCVECHQPQHLQWSRTKHARAWSGLVNVGRALDHACWSCHVTGAGKEGGPQVPSDNPGFRDVQCESCHGPGRAHAEAPTEVDLVVNPGEALCVECHDGVRDEGRFDYATYFPKIAHPTPPPPPAATDAAP